MDSVEIIVEISSEGTKYWEERIDLELPKNFEHDNLITVFYDEANDISNWTTEEGWNITTEKSVSPPYSFTDSPNEDYKGLTESKLTSKSEFKIINSINSFIEFDTKWFIDSWDYAMVQLSSDNGNSWKSIKRAIF